MSKIVAPFSEAEHGNLQLAIWDRSEALGILPPRRICYYCIADPVNPCDTYGTVMMWENEDEDSAPILEFECIVCCQGVTEEDEFEYIAKQVVDRVIKRLRA